MKKRRASIKRLIVLGVVLTVTLCSFQCSRYRMISSFSQHFENLEILESSKQKMIPGIASNLRSTDNYVVRLKCDLTHDVELKALLVDSVRLPIQALILEDVNQMKSKNVAAGHYENIHAYASRQHYSATEGNQQITEIEYELSGERLGGVSILEYTVDDKMYQLHLGALEIKSNLFAP